MTRTSSVRALLSLFGIVTLATAAIALNAFRDTQVARGISFPFALIVDCDASTGTIEASCTYPGGTPSITTRVVIQNNTGTYDPPTPGYNTNLAAMAFELIGDNQTVFNPPPGVDANFNANPDFDETGVGAVGSWNCNLVPSSPDVDPSPTVSASFLTCFATSLTVPPLNDGSTLSLAMVKYNVVGMGTLNLSFQNVVMGDTDGIELISCNPVATTEGDCIGAIVNVVPPTDTPTFTNTPTPTDTPTATETPTATDTPTATPTPSIPDTDGDGLNDVQEALLGTNPNDADSDDDGLNDGQEVMTTLTDPLDPDSDNDGLSDGDEVNTTNTNPHVADSDSDGLSDGDEVNTTNTDPNDADSDDDGVYDGPEVNTFNTDPNDADSDDDGLNDLQELVIGTDPNDADTDGDTLPDGQEVITLGTSPLLQDTDGDGLDDNVEVNTTNTDPTDFDTDNDSLGDGAEVNVHNTDPNDDDSDDDGIIDGGEVITYLSNPNAPDTDADTMPDGFEVLNSCLNILVQDGLFDPDGDAVQSVNELTQLTLPCNPDTDADGFKDKKSTTHDRNNANANVDNCIVDPNPSQLNSDADFVDLSPLLLDDLTHPVSDELGDPCDPDADADGLPNTTETGGPPCGTASGPTNPLAADSDGDRALDGAECLLGFNPNNPASRPTGAGGPTDPDSDRLNTFIEIVLGLNPNNNDTDGDGIADGTEVIAWNSNGALSDTDGDLCPDNREIASVNGDRLVNVIDLQIIAANVAVSPSPAYILGLDINRDGSTNVIDLQVVSRNVGAC